MNSLILSTEHKIVAQMCQRHKLVHQRPVHNQHKGRLHFIRVSVHFSFMKLRFQLNSLILSTDYRILAQMWQRHKLDPLLVPLNHRSEPQNRLKAFSICRFEICCNDEMTMKKIKPQKIQLNRIKQRRSKFQVHTCWRQNLNQKPQMHHLCPTCLTQIPKMVLLSTQRKQVAILVSLSNVLSIPNKSWTIS